MPYLPRQMSPVRRRRLTASDMRLSKESQSLKEEANVAAATDLNQCGCASEHLPIAHKPVVIWLLSLGGTHATGNRFQTTRTCPNF